MNSENLKLTTYSKNIGYNCMVLLTGINISYIWEPDHMQQGIFFDTVLYKLSFEQNNVNIQIRIK